MRAPFTLSQFCPGGISHSGKPHPTPRDCQGTAPRRGAALKCGRNLRFPHKRPLPKITPCGWISFAHRTKVSPNPCRRAAHRNYSLFTILYSLVSPRRNLTPRQTRPLPGNARELLPAGALRSNVAGTCGSPTNAPSQNAALGFAIGSACAAAFFIGGLSPS